MENKKKAAPKIAQIAGKIVSLLESLSSEDRHKAINGALVLLGESQHSNFGGSGGSGGPGAPELDGLHAKGSGWMKQHGLTAAQIERAFDITREGITVIADPPGKDKKEKTRNAYVLQGMSKYLFSGDSAFDDKSARQLCADLGCYDDKNHATYMKDKGNVLAGSKATGWKLTAPGLKHAADLVKELTKEE
jgi:hypothetical protein